MEWQQEWVEVLKPKMSLLKFRMSYHMKHGDKLTYLKGDILYGIWPKATSGETRLLVRKKDIGKPIQYDFQAYEETMFFHNKYIRSHCFHNISPDIKAFIETQNKTHNYCPCYDCVAELSVLSEYCKLVGFKLDQSFLDMFNSRYSGPKIPRG